MLKKLLNENYAKIKEEKDLEQKALDIVSILFSNKLDKGRKPYIEHLIKIKESVTSTNQKVVALLHDTIECLNIQKKDLIEIGFPENIVQTVEILSRKNNPKEDYNEYIERIITSNNEDALEVKLADLKHNMDITKIENPTIKDFSRIEKRYRPSYIKIQNKLDERKKAKC